MNNIMVLVFTTPVEKIVPKTTLSMTINNYWKMIDFWSFALFDAQR